MTATRLSTLLLSIEFALAIAAQLAAIGWMLARVMVA